MRPCPGRSAQSLRSYQGYVYLVPSVEEDEYYFLKTIIPSRKATRDYMGMGESDEET